MCAYTYIHTCMHTQARAYSFHKHKSHSFDWIWEVDDRKGVNMYVCVYACMYVMIEFGRSMTGKVWICMYACMHVCMYVMIEFGRSMTGKVWICMYACMHVCMYVMIEFGGFPWQERCEYVCMCVCMYVCMLWLSLGVPWQERCVHVCMYISICMHVMNEFGKPMTWELCICMHAM